ncbi:NAD-dependent epimerase/dehydratase family protein [Paracoccus luteus]|uniref:NAD-dependent epimerase/dehydratase family protein n=1 Tax=Paracoccus luteus TaxID=2508543 RepID=UPI00106FF235|nr:NAD(P)-dependent oxidoreductase [Paracoccus luteus]
MRIAITGATGIVGGFMVDAARAAGHRVEALPGWRLGQPAPLSGCDAVIHAALAHAPGRYRGGEGDDPAGFVAANRDGTLRLFDDADRAGARVVFLSSRAVHDGWPAGTALPDGTAARPASLYGQVKAQAESALPAQGAALRATGVYGPGRANKWAGLFADYRAGRPIAPRVATEVHGADLARAALLVLDRGASGVFNVSDLVLDRHDLLGGVQQLTGCPHPPPPRADAGALSVMGCARLAALGWKPGGMALLRATLPQLLA